jgi:hypothetical protein
MQNAGMLSRIMVQQWHAIIVLGCLGLLLLLQPTAHAQRPPNNVTVGLSFSSLTGPNGAAYLGSSDSGFAITPTLGSWYQAMIYGTPFPSIFDGPVNTPGVAALQITDGAGLFTFSSMDYSSNNGDSSYDIEGFLGATLRFHETGTLMGVSTPFHFSTLLSGDPTLPIDGLLIEIIPGAGVTSINLDNIMVTTVPEPGAFGFLGLGALAIVVRRCGIRKSTIRK